MTPTSSRTTPAHTDPATAPRWVRLAGRAMILACLFGAAVGYGTDHVGPRTSATWLTLDADRTSPAASRTHERGPVPVTITVIDGTTTTAYAVDPDAPTIGAALVGRGIVLGPADHLTPAPQTALPAEATTVTITRAQTTVRTEERVTPHTRRTVDDPTRPTGTTTVLQAGVDGLTRTTYAVTVAADGTELARELLMSVPAQAMVEEVIATGTKPRPQPAPAAVPAPRGAPITPGTARQIGHDLLTARGWGQDQWQCLDALWTKESGWRVGADNPSSSAYGIPQALPGSKMASAGPDWQTNPATQITWGLGYISSRYGTPCAAWAHSTARNWY